MAWIKYDLAAETKRPIGTVATILRKFRVLQISKLRSSLDDLGEEKLQGISEGSYQKVGCSYQKKPKQKDH